MSHLRLLGLLILILAGCGMTDDIENSIVDPTQIASVAPFNSCCGHAYPDNSPTSQKVYLTPIAALAGTQDQIAISSPCTGQILSARPEGGGCNSGASRGNQIRISCKRNLAGEITIFHVNLNSNLGAGSVIRAGQALGYANVYCPEGGNIDFDIAYHSSVGTLDSVFNHMTESAAGPWIDRGLDLSSTTVAPSSCDFSTPTVCASQTIDLP
jgi:hypothetical protein